MLILKLVTGIQKVKRTELQVGPSTQGLNPPVIVSLGVSKRLKRDSSGPSKKDLFEIDPDSQRIADGRGRLLRTSPRPKISGPELSGSLAEGCR
jgi:hypothetical protein